MDDAKSGKTLTRVGYTDHRAGSKETISHMRGGAIEGLREGERRKGHQTYYGVNPALPEDNLAVMKSGPESKTPGSQNRPLMSKRTVNHAARNAISVQGLARASKDGHTTYDTTWPVADRMNCSMVFDFDNAANLASGKLSNLLKLAEQMLWILDQLQHRRLAVGQIVRNMLRVDVHIVDRSTSRSWALEIISTHCGLGDEMREAAPNVVRPQYRKWYFHRVCWEQGPSRVPVKPSRIHDDKLEDCDETF
ncbi:hypothetical protein V8B97DRAFT_1917866 [Scleroderma yunnanense]